MNKHPVEDVRLQGGLPASHSLARIVTDLWGVTRAPGTAAAPTFPTFDQLWQATDETVDWTEALVREQPADGTADRERWQFYHQQAAAVLSGDTSAYCAVLRKADPLGDLRPYARAFVVSAPDADTLRCTVTPEPALLQGEDAARRRYLCGLALRIARDLMALLPVCQVAVLCPGEPVPLLEATYAREALQDLRFGLIDPVELTLSLGGRCP